MNRPNEPVQSDALAYFITWTTYGTWLPGDHRGWSSDAIGMQPANYELRRDARSRMQEAPLVLDAAQRKIVEVTVVEHCRIRGWHLFTVNCRSNHAHVVVRANRHPDIVQGQFKSWSTRRLRGNDLDRAGQRKRWWSEGGSCRFLNDEASLEAAIVYVRDAQELPR